jgi:hypothetical protein
MRYERVHAVWGYYDGVRVGIADLDGAPHYFDSLFDEDAEDYSDNFRLYPVGPEFMQRAMRSWDIYRAWESRFHNGKTDIKTHPGLGGIDIEFDELRSWLDEQVTRLEALPSLYRAQFRELRSQESLPGAMFPEMEVTWSPSSA